jgi:anti-sigma regulatory factor (Ser/Thr protein kinase)
VEEFCTRFRACRDEFGRSANWFGTELLLREALTNAVVHGCARNPGLQVGCRVRLRADFLVIAVWDQGQGFDWKSAAAGTAGKQDTTGRGLAIIQTYSARFRFNTKGNAVVMLRRYQ